MDFSDIRNRSESSTNWWRREYFGRKIASARTNGASQRKNPLLWPVQLMAVEAQPAATFVHCWIQVLFFGNGPTSVEGRPCWDVSTRLNPEQSVTIVRAKTLEIIRRW